MNVSPAYKKEYQDWIRNGRFEEVYGHAAQKLPDALSKQHPALVATYLSSIATCYHSRGVVTLLDQDLSGWRDVQCGYWATVYALGFEYKAVTLPAFSEGRSFRADKKVEAALTLGFARLFGQDADAAWLESLIGTNFDVEEVLGDKVHSGRKILESILDTKISISFAELLKDRKESCQKRDAWPKRPTEIRPFGVIDIEAMLRFPQDASFQYPASFGFNPSEDA